MAKVYLSLGSNIEREHHLTLAVHNLAQRFGALELSPVYESEAVGFKGSPFFNMIVAIDTELALVALSRELKAMEDAQGRDRKAAKFAPRTMDIDIVTYDDLAGTYDGIELPRPELYYNAFVLKPMADLAPNFADPKSGQLMKDLWQAYQGQQALWQIDVDLGYTA